MSAAASNSTTFGQLPPSRWPGERLGLPNEGTRSVGRVGRRIGALALDWALAYGAAALFFSTSGVVNGFAVTAIFVGLQIVFIPTIGGSIGHRLVGLRVVPLQPGWVGLWRPVVRSLLLGLAVPALVWDSDQRGFHDKVAGTVLIRS
ncbi:RDD family protein [Cryobacterium sp. TMT1-19]|uniref:RDD family protein n=1 Tax=unclassified Cryobacterium TaxID=2649013 RepID=UPI000CE47028|nr:MULTISPECIES: RDD family protein [unclassified Cryobacterium]TFB54885.1 RDD family protein [Cryobacterium sp. Sr3]TFC32264.1 RDD family protein [Cryobacterium sp. TMT2-18-2]TFC36926.1 RDD family protein [Cryobacterium sp. TMT2-42-4]TFC54866.1 RDD family protein [Cryobacterium sp. TMT2-17-1]TFC61108.1 RDD family protein [Cryobacterium sp. TMT2-15-1]